ncbi:hypothetical protein MTO96_037753 [Rhipicephalus appendiculatus]
MSKPPLLLLPLLLQKPHLNFVQLLLLLHSHSVQLSLLGQLLPTQAHLHDMQLRFAPLIILECLHSGSNFWGEHPLYRCNADFVPISTAGVRLCQPKRPRFPVEQLSVLFVARCSLQQTLSEHVQGYLQGDLGWMVAQHATL